MSSRRPLVSGNWKMNLTHLEAIAVVQKLAYGLGHDVGTKVEVSVHPAFTSLRSVQTVIDADELPLALGAQDVCWEQSGAFTGEVSPSMLSKLNVSYVIVGHSERRQYFGETDEMVARKLRAVLEAGMSPIVCVGETLEERDAGGTEEKVLGQLRTALKGLDGALVSRLVIAYEPVWAIGTGRNATPEDAQAVCGLLRSELSAAFGSAEAAAVRIQYGGSVRESNMAGFMAEPDIDGALVGGASLDPEEFARIAALAVPAGARGA
jgi:triosephosphate isomerase